MGGGPTPITCPPTMPSAETTATSHPATPQPPPNKTKPDPSTCAAVFGLVLLGFVFLAPFIVLVITAISDSNIDHPTFKIDSMSIPPFKTSAANRIIAATNTINLTLTVKNPSHGSDVVYDNIVVSVFFKKELVLVGTFAPFHHEAGERKSVSASVVAWPTFMESWVLSALADKGNGSPSRGRVFSVGIVSRIKREKGTHEESESGIRVFCKDLKIEYTSDLEGVGAMSGPPKNCSVHVGDWSRY